MALNARILVVTVHLFVTSMLLEKGICDDICPNGITNVTGLTSGEIMYPSSGTYGVNETKCWRIDIPKPYRGIGLTYHYVETEECDGCHCDFFKFSRFYYALSLTDDSCGRFSPSYMEYTNLIRGPRPFVVANGENFYLKLKTDDSVHHKGFRISFIAKSEDSGSKSFLNVSQGEISTPKFGTKNYPANFAWQWFILAPEGHQVTITFDSFELEQSENCKNDFLEVRKAYFKDLYDPGELQAVFGEILAKPMCGSTKPSTIQSAGNMVWVHFESDSFSSTTYKGFKASFTTSGQGRLPISNLLTVLFISALLMCAK